MAKRRTDLDDQIDEATADWVSISRGQDPVEWGAWTAWREREMRTHARPDNLTVPTPFPPATVSAAKAYLDVVQKIRRAQGWTAANSRLTTDPRAWMPTDRGVPAT